MSRYLEDVEERGFYELVGDAFIYPLRGQGKSLLVVGALFFMVVHWVQHYMWMAFVLTIVMAGYLCAFMFSIVSRSASGDPEPPGWPDISDAYEDIVRPLLVVVGAIVVSMLPAIVLELGHIFDGWQTEDAALIAASAGLFYLPMALLGVCMTESPLMASPHIVLPAILKVPIEYLTACVALAVTVAVRWMLVPWLAAEVPYAGAFMAEFLALYCLVFEMRILGVLYYTRQRRLGWFT